MMKTVLSIQTSVTTQTVLASTLLRLSASDLEEAVKRELAANPALEVVEPNPIQKQTRVERLAHFERGIESKQAGRLRSTTAWDDGDPEPFEQLAAVPSSRELLIRQARLNIPDDVLDVVCYLVYSLDEHGFLRIPEANLAQELGISYEHILQGIAWLQKLDPPGIGARDLRECFLLQCAHLEGMGIHCSHILAILHAAWDSFSRQQWGSVLKEANVSRLQLETALQFIRENLYPYPLSLVDGEPVRGNALTRPDLIVRRNTGAGGATFLVVVPSTAMDHLRISDAYQLAASPTPVGAAQLAPGERESICQAVDRARRFINAAEQRRATLRRTGEYIVAFQQDFLEQGPPYLKPLTRAAVAAALGVHESTISRAVSDKILQLPNRQLVELSDLFDRSLAAKEAIRQLVQMSGRPLSDREIAAQLLEQSLQLSRRTVAKYRAQLGISTMGRRQSVLHSAY